MAIVLRTAEVALPCDNKPPNPSTMQGTLFKYGPKPQHLAFASNLTAAKQVVLIGGLTDGLLFAPYAARLAPAVAAEGWSLLQAQLSSSYQGFGVACLDQDAAEIHLLLQHLAREHSVTHVVLLGHSTGCQDAVRYMQRYGKHKHAEQPPSDQPPYKDDTEDAGLLISGVVLQAPVSDSEWLHMYSDQLEPLLPAAKKLMEEERGQQILTRLELLDGVPITADRFLSLYQPHGDDDMFSHHLSDEQLQHIGAPLQGTPCLILCSGADEAVPPDLQPGIADMGQRLAIAMGPTAAVAVLPGAPHNGEGHEEELVEAVVRWLQQL